MKSIFSIGVICLFGLFSSIECCPKQIKEFFTGPEQKVLVVEYQGCYPGDAHFTATEYPQINLNLCNQNCYQKGSKYMGLIGNKCFCDSYLETNDKLDDSLCTTPCPGEASEKCGNEAENPSERRYSAYTTAPKYP